MGNGAFEDYCPTKQKATVFPKKVDAGFHVSLKNPPKPQNPNPKPQTLNPQL